MIFHRNDVTFSCFHEKRCKITAFFWIDQIIGAHHPECYSSRYFCVGCRESGLRLLLVSRFGNLDTIFSSQINGISRSK